jgi:hypothetical protein
MLRRNRKKTPSILAFRTIVVFLTLLVFTPNLVFATGGSIAMTNYYPANGGTYEVASHFLLQTTGVNSNTTVSVSIDGGAPISMAYQGVRSEIVPGNTLARELYTWQVSIPAITSSGEHTFQFFSHYYVWQDTDQYWADFNSCSEVRTFTIVESNQKFSPPQTPTPVPLSCTVLPPTETPNAFLHIALAALVVIFTGALFLRERK